MAWKCFHSFWNCVKIPLCLETAFCRLWHHSYPTVSSRCQQLVSDLWTFYIYIRLSFSCSVSHYWSKGACVPHDLRIYAICDVTIYLVPPNWKIWTNPAESQPYCLAGRCNGVWYDCRIIFFIQWMYNYYSGLGHCRFLIKWSIKKYLYSNFHICIF